MDYKSNFTAITNSFFKRETFNLLFIISYYYALEIDPKNSITWNNKGVALNNLGKYSEAIKWYLMNFKIIFILVTIKHYK